MTYTVVGYRALLRRLPGSDERRTGPYHAMLSGGTRQAWCGSRVTGIGFTAQSERPDESLMCPGCLAALRAERPKAYSRSR